METRNLDVFCLFFLGSAELLKWTKRFRIFKKRQIFTLLLYRRSGTSLEAILTFSINIRVSRKTYFKSNKRSYFWHFKQVVNDFLSKQYGAMVLLHKSHTISGRPTSIHQRRSTFLALSTDKKHAISVDKNVVRHIHSLFMNRSCCFVVYHKNHFSS